MRKVFLFISVLLLAVSCDTNQDRAAELETIQFDAKSSENQ